MKAKQFFTHAGLAMGYYAYFFLLQFWVTILYTIGISISTVTSTPFVTDELINTLLFEQMDIIMLLVYAACLLFFGCFLFAENPDSPLREAKFKLPRRAVMVWSPIVLGAGLFFATQGGIMLIPEDAPLMQDYLDSVSALEFGKYPFLSFVTTVIGAPLVEEFLFRGLMYKHLKRAMPLWLAFVLQAALFALAHGQLLWMVYTFVMGAVLGLLYDYFDSLWPCILAHLVFNGCNYLPFLANLTLEPIGWLTVLLASLLLCALMLLMMLVYRRITAPAASAHKDGPYSSAPAQEPPQPTPRTPAVLFDFNGTLFFDGALQEKAWRTYLESKIGRPVTDEEFRDHIHGRSAAATFSYFFGREVPQEEAAVLEEEKELIYRSLCLESSDFHLENGVPEFLDALQAHGIPFTIATASALPNTRFFFEHLPLDRWFDFDKVVYSDGSLPGKPAPDLYLKAAANLHADPADCIIFEDAKSGILAAKNAGARLVVGVTSSMTAETLAQLGADLTIDGYSADLAERILP